jgi:sarcosine oxidase
VTASGVVARHDAIVIGLGVMGSAATWRLASRGLRVLAFDRYTPPHPFGSTHGRSRIIREAYFEHPSYVPFVRRAYELWDETERASGERLFLRTRGLMIGSPDGEVVAGSLGSAREHGVQHELLTSAEVRRRFPVLRPDDGMVALLEERSGILFPEAIVNAQLRLARAAGAELRTETPVISWSADGNGARVTTGNGSEHVAERLVLAAGPWMPQLLRGLDVPIECERQLMYWFVPVEPAGFDPASCPIAIWDDPGRPAFATFPDLGDGVKFAIHHGGAPAEPDTLDRTSHPEDEEAARDCLARYVPAANGALKEAAVCIYTNAPDEHFIIDYLDDARRVLIVSACSGHGFKFGSAVGEAVACLATDTQPPVDLSPFALSRFRGIARATGGI